jgi:hypothetical protein
MGVVGPAGWWTGCHHRRRRAKLAAGRGALGEEARPCVCRGGNRESCPPYFGAVSDSQQHLGKNFQFSSSRFFSIHPLACLMQERLALYL